MLRSLLCAVFAVALCVVTVMAGEYRGVITKVEGDKVTVKVKGEEKTFSLSDTVEISAGKKAIAKEGLSERLEKSKKKALGALVVTEGSGASEKVVKITLGGGGKKGKKKTDQ